MDYNQLEQNSHYANSLDNISQNNLIQQHQLDQLQQNNVQEDTLEEDQDDFELYKKKLQENVKEYLQIDDEIKALNKAIKERKKKKIDLSQYILACMNKFEINHMNITGGKLIYSVSKNKAPLNKNNITNLLTKYFDNDTKGAEVCNYILENREKIERVRLKRTHHKK